MNSLILLLFQALTGQEIREIILFVIAVIGCLGGFVSVVAMFVTVRETVKMQGRTIDEQGKGIKEIDGKLDLITEKLQNTNLLDERISNLSKRIEKLER